MDDLLVSSQFVYDLDEVAQPVVLPQRDLQADR